jgi:hypothetical protein
MVQQITDHILIEKGFRFFYPGWYRSDPFFTIYKSESGYRHPAGTIDMKEITELENLYTALHGKKL